MTDQALSFENVAGPIDWSFEARIGVSLDEQLRTSPTMEGELHGYGWTGSL